MAVKAKPLPRDTTYIDAGPCDRCGTYTASRRNKSHKRGLTSLCPECDWIIHGSAHARTGHLNYQQKHRLFRDRLGALAKRHRQAMTAFNHAQSDGKPLLKYRPVQSNDLTTLSTNRKAVEPLHLPASPDKAADNGNAMTDELAEPQTAGGASESHAPTPTRAAMIQAG